MKTKLAIFLVLVAGLIANLAFATPYQCQTTYQGQNCGTGYNVMLGLNCAPDTAPGDPNASSKASWDAYCDALTHGSGVICTSTAYNAAYNAASCACDTGYAGAGCASCASGYVDMGDGTCRSESSLIYDADKNTYVTTEYSPNENVVRTYLNGDQSFLQYLDVGTGQPYLSGGVTSDGTGDTTVFSSGFATASSGKSSGNLVLNIGSPDGAGTYGNVQFWRGTQDDHYLDIDYTPGYPRNKTEISTPQGTLTGNGMDLYMTAADGYDEGLGGRVFISAGRPLSNSGAYQNGSDIYLTHGYVGGGNPPTQTREGRIYISSLASPTTPSIAMWNTTISGYPDSEDITGNYGTLTVASAPGFPGTNQSGTDLHLSIGEKASGGTTNGKLLIESSLKSSGMYNDTFPGFEVTIDRSTKTARLAGYSYPGYEGNNVVIESGVGYPAGSHRGGDLGFFTGEGHDSDDGKFLWGQTDGTARTDILWGMADASGDKGPEFMFMGAPPTTDRDGYTIGLMSNEGNDSGSTARKGGTLLLGSGIGINGGDDGTIIQIHELGKDTIPISGLMFDYKDSDKMLGVHPASQAMFDGPVNADGYHVMLASADGEVGSGSEQVLSNEDFEQWPPGPNPSNWSFAANGESHSLNKDTSTPYHGSNAAYVTLNYTSGTEPAILYSNITPLTVGSSFSTMTLYAKKTGSPNFIIAFVDHFGPGSMIWNYTGADAGTYTAMGASPTSDQVFAYTGSVGGTWAQVDLLALMTAAGAAHPTVPTGGTITPLFVTTGVSTDVAYFDYMNFEQTMPTTGGKSGSLYVMTGSSAGTGNNDSGNMKFILGTPTGSGAQGVMTYGLNGDDEILYQSFGGTYNTTIWNSTYVSDPSGVAYRFSIDDAVTNGIMFQVDDGASTPEFRILRNGGVSITTKNTTEMNPPAGLFVTGSYKTGLATSGDYPNVSIGQGAYSQWDTSSDPTIDVGSLVHIYEGQFSASDAATMGEAASFYVDSEPNVTGALTATNKYAGLFKGRVGIIGESDARTQNGLNLVMGKDGLTQTGLNSFEIEMNVKENGQAGQLINMISHGLGANDTVYGQGVFNTTSSSDNASAGYVGYVAGADTHLKTPGSSIAYLSLETENGGNATDFATQAKDMLIEALPPTNDDGYDVTIKASAGVGTDKGGGILKLAGGAYTGTGAPGFVQVGTGALSPTYANGGSSLFVQGRLEVAAPAYFTYTTNPAAYAARFEGPISIASGTVPSVNALGLYFNDQNDSGMYYDATSDMIGWYVQGYQTMEMDRVAITGITVNEVRAPRWTSISDSIKLIGSYADGATAIANKVGNKNPMATPGGLISAFYPGDPDASPAVGKVAGIGYNGAGYFGSNAIGTEWSTSQLVASNGNTGVDIHTAYDVAGVFESLPSAHEGAGVYATAETTSSYAATAGIFYAQTGTTTDAHAATAVMATSEDTHAAGNNVAYYANAAGSSTGNFAFYGIAGWIYSGDNLYLGTLTADTDYPDALGVSSMGRYSSASAVDTNRIGFVGEASADADQEGYGLFGAAKTSSAKQAFGVVGIAKANATTDAHAAIGVVGISDQSHSAADNIAVYGFAGGATSSGFNYSFYGANGDMYNGGKELYRYSTIQELTTSTSMTVTYSVMRVAGDGGAVTGCGLQDGPADKSMIGYIIGTSDVNKVTFADGTNLRLPAGADCELGYGDVMTVMWEPNIGDWLGITCTNN